MKVFGILFWIKKQIMKTEKAIRVKPYMPSELSIIYSVSHPTLNRWLTSIKDKVGKRIGQYYSVKQVEIILWRINLSILRLIFK